MQRAELPAADKLQLIKTKKRYARTLTILRPPP